MTEYRVDPAFPASKMVKISPDDVVVEHEYTLADMIPQDTSGTTDTDSKTHGNYGRGSGYTKIYAKY